MFMVRIPVREPEADTLIAELWEAGTAGVTEGPGYVEAFFDDERIARRFGEPHPVEPVDWEAQFKRQWPPLEVGNKFFVVPPWNEDSTPEGRFRLVIDPGRQCGTGQHPCTQKCLEAMERLVFPGCRMLDVGSGSGILSIAARMLGAGLVVACDIDLEVAATRELLSGYDVPLFIGGADAVRSGMFDVVVANISEEVLGSLRPDLERVSPVRILSGFQDEAGEWTCVIDGSLE